MLAAPAILHSQSLEYAPAQGEPFRYRTRNQLTVTQQILERENFYTLRADGVVRLTLMNPGERLLWRLGYEELSLRIDGRGLGGLRAPAMSLDAGNSGSTMRMLAGVLAAHPFASTMGGDESLSRRPMKRVILPLERMGARIASQDGRPPLTIQGVAAPTPIDFEPEVPSAQVKSAVLLAGLHGDGSTRVREKFSSAGRLTR